MNFGFIIYKWGEAASLLLILWGIKSDNIYKAQNAMFGLMFIKYQNNKKEKTRDVFRTIQGKLQEAQPLPDHTV